MRRAVLLFLLVVPASAAAESIKLGTKPPAVGETWTFDATNVADLTIAPKGSGRIAYATTSVEKKKIEVLAVKDDTITKARIAYEKLGTTEKVDGKAKVTPSAVEGKTYTLTAGDPITVEPAGNADEVRKEEKRFGKHSRFRHAIAGKEFAKGKVVKLPDDASDAFGDPDEFDMKLFTVEYTGMVGKNAKLAMVLRATGKPSNPKTAGMTVDLKGAVVVDVATSEPLELELSGPVKQDNANVKVDGTMSLTVRRSVSK